MKKKKKNSIVTIMKWGNLSMMPSIETPNLPSKEKRKKRNTESNFPYIVEYLWIKEKWKNSLSNK